MADAPASEAAPVNGANAAAPAPVVDDRAAFLADMAKERGAEPAKPATPAPGTQAPAGTPPTDSIKEAKEQGAGAAGDDITDADLDEPADTAAPEDPDADLDDEDEVAALAKQAKTDPDLARRLGTLQKHEQRQRAAFDRDRQAFEREKAAWMEQTKPIAEAAKRFESIGARIQTDTLGVLEELKVPPAAFEAIARSVFAVTDIGKQDPKNAAYAAELRRKQAERSEAAELRAKLEGIESQMRESQARAQQDAVLNDYFGRVAKTANDKTPLTAKLLASNPTKARAELEQVAYALAQQTGSLPTEKAVVIAYEKQRRQQLRDLGIDPKAIGAKPAANDETKKVDAKPAGKPAKKVEAVEAPPKEDDHPRERDSRARDPMRDQFLADMAKLRAQQRDN